MGASAGKDCGLVSVLSFSEALLIAQHMVLHAQSSTVVRRRVSARRCQSDS